MKYITKLIIIVILMIIIINIMTTISSAAFSLQNVIEQAKAFPGSGSKINEADLKEAQAMVYNILLWIGIIVAVIGSVVLGIQFVTSTPEGKADVKARAIPFLIGTIVIFGGFTIWKIALNIAQSIAP